MYMSTSINIDELTYSNYPYHYRMLQDAFCEEEIRSYRNSLLENFSKLTKSWTEDLHSEWTARMFLAAKMIYSASLLLNTLDYSQRKNIRVTEPYLLYYSLYNCCRALVLSYPNEMWRNGKTDGETHIKVINIASSIIKRLNKQIGVDLNDLLLKAKNYRELFSYKYPAGGLKKDEIFDDLNIDLISKQCSLICEAAQYTSECFQFSFDKNCAKDKYSLKMDVLESCFSYQGHNSLIIDEYDAYRVSYIMRKSVRPYSIFYTMSEGMTDDVFGSWVASEDCDSDCFDPDERRINIFDLP